LKGEIYVTGGLQRDAGLREHGEWNLFDRARVLRVDADQNSVTICADYVSPAGCRPDGESSSAFEGGTLEGDRLYTCTRTEALVYQLPEFRLLERVSLPCFNDVHHVRPTPEGNLIVTNTGLDMVVEVTPDGRILREWGVLGQDPWARFSRQVDYRRVPSTKPHASHPNYSFFLDGELWVTRCEQKDAVCLTRVGARINVAVERCHDGIVRDDSVYFTTVDGNVVIADRESYEVRTVVDLKDIDNPRHALLGWCRGLGLVDDARVWVGFTRIRKTRLTENVQWIKNLLYPEAKPTHIALYNLRTGECLAEIDLEPFGMDAIFGIFPINAVSPHIRTKVSRSLLDVR
jgi:hypothetical protein